MKFEAAIALAKSRSDCDPKNVDTLSSLIQGLKKVPGDIIECGSYRCGMTIALAASDPLKTVYAFDMFGGLPYGEGAGFENFGNTSFSEIQESTKPFKNIVLIQGKHENTVLKFPERDISFLFMDSDHYSSHVVCLNKFWPLLSSGGMIAFHDWIFSDVQKAIAETINNPASSGIFSDSPNMGYITKA